MSFWLLAARVECPECGKPARLREVLVYRTAADGTRFPSNEVQYICGHCLATGETENVELPEGETMAKPPRPPRPRPSPDPVRIPREPPPRPK